MTVVKFVPNQIVLAVAAHADDIDVKGGGAVAEWIKKANVTVYLLVLTDGSKGTADPSQDLDDLVAKRQQEQREAAKRLGITDVFFAGFEDGQLYDNPETRGVVVRYIRELKPDTVLGWDPDYKKCRHYGLNHPDHQAAGAIMCAAVYPLARDHANYPEQELPTHAVEHLLLINPNIVRHPGPDDDIVVYDIADTFDTKAEAVRTHTSQADGLGPIDDLRAYDAETAEYFDLKLAEAFVYIHQPI